MNVWFVYVDYTDDGRPFYVGKGIEARVNERDRNSDWKDIVREHGWHREVIFGTRDESAAYELEERLVEEYDTFHEWGANLNKGGYGQKSGWKHSRNTRARMSLSQSERERGPRSEETRRLLSERQRGKVPGNKGKPGKSPPNKGVPMSEEAKRHLSELNKGKPSNRRGVKLSVETRRRLSDSHLGQTPWNKKFTDETVAAMIQDRQSGMMVKEVASKHGTTAPTVCRLIKRYKETHG